MPHLYIVRTHSPLTWLHDVPSGCDVTVQDLRRDLDASQLPEWVELRQTPVAKELAGAFLHEMVNKRITDPNDFTVFCCEEPLAHSPDLLALLKSPHLWGDLQPLSSVACADRGMPPASILTQDTRGHVSGMSVRPGHFSLSTLLPVGYFDPEVLRRSEAYRQRHDLGPGVNLMAHFLDMCGLASLAEQALSADIGVMTQGNIFAVRNNRLLTLQRNFAEELARMEPFARTWQGDPLLWEHLWLHLLGEPFVRFESNERPDERAEPVDKAMARVVASIDAVLAQAHTGSHARPPVAPETIAQGIDTLRERARVATAAGRPDEGMRLLNQARMRQPDHVGVLSDSCGLAWQTGDLDAAIEFARAALRIDFSASICVYVLGMALGRRGDQQESRTWLRAILKDPSFRLFRKERPDLLEAALRELERQRNAPGAIVTTVEIDARDDILTPHVHGRGRAAA